MSLDSLIRKVESLVDHIHIEMLDDYIRVKGDTYAVRGKLKLLGFQWNPNAREWYYSPKGIDLNENE